MVKTEVFKMSNRNNRTHNIYVKKKTIKRKKKQDINNIYNQIKWKPQMNTWAMFLILQCFFSQQIGWLFRIYY